MSDEILEIIRKRMGDDAELAVKLYRAYKEGGRRGLISLINELLGREGLRLIQDDDQ
jgi:hypothetical protein